MSDRTPFEPMARPRAESAALPPAPPGLLVPREASLRVATLNLWYAEDERRARHRVAGRLAATLEADALLVREVAWGSLEDTLEVLISESGLTLAAVSPETTGPRTAVLTRLPVEPRSPIRYTVPESPYDQLAACASVTTPSGRSLLLVSTHLMWGGLLEHRRLLQAAALDAAVSSALADPTAAAVLGGDFNTLPHSSTVRYLTGIEPFESRTAQWSDAFAQAGVGSGVTSTGANPWARMTAERHGFLEPAGIPERRIDYLFVRGYPYGRPFAPLRCFSVGPDLVASLLPSEGFAPSDHDMVVADLWDPPLTGSAYA